MTFLPIIIVMIFSLSSLASTEINIGKLLSLSLLSCVVQALLLFVLSTLSCNLAATSVGREGKAAWMLNVLPISGWQIALGKFWISWLIPMVLASILEIGLGIILNWSVGWTLLGMIMFALISMGMTGIGLWMGTLGARYSAENLRNRLKLRYRIFNDDS